jgi:site-specific recombinase XerC
MLTDPAVTSITIGFALSPHERQSASRTPRRESATSNATRTRPHTATAETSHSYVTHVTEFDYPERFIQDQVGHCYASTTSIYSHVSDEYRNRLVCAPLAKRGLAFKEVQQ